MTDYRAPKCKHCKDTGYYDFAGFSMDPCTCSEERANFANALSALEESIEVHDGHGVKFVEIDIQHARTLLAALRK